VERLEGVSGRLRIVGYLVQPQVMVDDGDNLTPLSVNPVNVSAADWPNVVELLADGVEQLRQQVELAEPAPAPAPNRASRRHPPKL
jgi:hypothetical protein